MVFLDIPDSFDKLKSDAEIGYNKNFVCVRGVCFLVSTYKKSFELSYDGLMFLQG